MALEDGGEERGDQVGQNDTGEGVAAAAEPFMREDAEIEEENGDLGEVDGHFVGELAQVVELSPR